LKKDAYITFVTISANFQKKAGNVFENKLMFKISDDYAY